jgi:hypothetical protein
VLRQLQTVKVHLLIVGDRTLRLRLHRVDRVARFARRDGISKREGGRNVRSTRGPK